MGVDWDGGEVFEAEHKGYHMERGGTDYQFWQILSHEDGRVIDPRLSGMWTSRERAMREIDIHEEIGSATEPSPVTEQQKEKETT